MDLLIQNIVSLLFICHCSISIKATEQQLFSTNVVHVLDHVGVLKPQQFAADCISHAQLFL